MTQNTPNHTADNKYPAVNLKFFRSATIPVK